MIVLRAAAADPHADVDVALVVLALVGELDVNAMSEPAGMRLAVSPGCERQVADRVLDEAVAVQAGRGLAARAAARRRRRASAPSRSATVVGVEPVEVRQELRVRRSSWPPISFSSSASWMNGITRAS